VIARPSCHKNLAAPLKTLFHIQNKIVKSCFISKTRLLRVTAATEREVFSVEKYRKFNIPTTCTVTLDITLTRDYGQSPTKNSDKLHV
jgi:hypothetical protein